MTAVYVVGLRRLLRAGRPLCPSRDSPLHGGLPGLSPLLVAFLGGGWLCVGPRWCRGVGSVCTMAPAPPVTLAWAAASAQTCCPRAYGVPSSLCWITSLGAPRLTALAVTLQLLPWVGMGGAVAGEPAAPGSLSPGSVAD